MSKSISEIIKMWEHPLENMKKVPSKKNQKKKKKEILPSYDPGSRGTDDSSS